MRLAILLLLLPAVVCAGIIGGGIVGQDFGQRGTEVPDGVEVTWQGNANVQLNGVDAIW